jgi:hypothetical protein
MAQPDSSRGYPPAPDGPTRGSAGRSATAPAARARSGAKDLGRPATADEILGTPVALGPITLANRLVIAPHTVNFGFLRRLPG